MKGKLNTVVDKRRLWPATATASGIGGPIATTMLAVLLVACQASDMADIGTGLPTPTLAQTMTTNATHLPLEPLDQPVLDRPSSMHDSDLPGASIAAYGT